MESVVNISILMSKIADVMDIPLIMTEQNPKVFGNTIDQLS